MVNTYTCAAFVHEVYRLAGVERLAELPNGYGIDYVPGMVDAADHAGFLRLKNPRNVMAGDMMTVRSDSSSSGLHAVLALAVTDKGIEVASEPGSSGRPEIKMYDWEALERAEKGHGQFYSAHRAPPQLVTSEAPPLVTETPPAGPVEDPALTETNSEPSPRLASVMGGPPPPTKRDFEQWEERDGGPGPLGPLLGESDPPRELSDGSLPGTPGVSPRLQQALHLQPPLSAPAPPPQPSPSPPLAEPDLPPPAAISPAGEPQELTPEVSSRLSEALGMPNSVSPALEPARRSRATAKDMLSGERTFAEFLQDQAAELASSVIGPPLHMVGRKP
ncbi:MAG: hypothetical protein GY838_13725, partial [bacterium]|nr:hypothetical protein [bacterium]